VSCSDGYDTSVIDSYVDWDLADWLGFLSITPDVLAAMAAHATAEVGEES
jgi:hypothetical protein